MILQFAFAELHHRKPNQSTLTSRGRGAVNGREGKYPWNRVGQGPSKGAGGLAAGQPQNTYSNDFAAGRRSSNGPSSSKPWEGQAGWQKNPRDSGRGAKWSDRGRGESLSNYLFFYLFI